MDAIQSPGVTRARPSATRSCCAILISLWLTALLAPAGMAGEEATVDGVLHIRNGATPSQGEETMQLEELWRVGGEDDESILLGVILQVRSDEEGNIYLLDGQLSHVEVFSPDGEHLRTLGSEGDGPGQIRRPSDLVLMPGGEVGMLRNFPGKVILVDRQGDPAGEMSLGGDDPTEGGFSIARVGHCRGGNLVFGATDVSQARPGVQHRTSYLAAFAPDGTRQATYVTHDYVFDFTDFSFSEAEHIDWPIRRYAVGPDGRVFSASERDRYVITAFNSDGTIDRVIEREYEIEQRTSGEVQELYDLLEAALQEIPFEFEIKVEKTEPPIIWIQNGLHVNEDGALWVLNSRSVRNQPDGIMQTYDVLDPAGHFVKRVAVACEGDGEQDYLFFTGRDRVVLVTGFIDALRAVLGGGSTGEEDEEEPAPMEVICYAIR